MDDENSDQSGQSEGAPGSSPGPDISSLLSNPYRLGGSSRNYMWQVIYFRDDPVGTHADFDLVDEVRNLEI